MKLAQNQVCDALMRPEPQALQKRLFLVCTPSNWVSADCQLSDKEFYGSITLYNYFSCISYIFYINFIYITYIICVTLPKFSREGIRVEFIIYHLIDIVSVKFMYLH